MAKLLNLNVNFISVVDDGANRKPMIYKNDIGDKARFDLPIRYDVQKMDEKQIVYGIVYEPDTVDTQNDWADAPTIERAAHDFLIKGKVRMVDTMHDYTPIDGGVVESFIKNGEAKNYPEAKDGAWLVAIKLDQATAQKVKSGEYRGLSLSGTALPSDEKRKSSGQSSADLSPAQLIQNLKNAQQWPASYDQPGPEGATMTDIFNAIQANCDDKGIMVGNQMGVLDALAAKLAQASPNGSPATGEKSARIIKNSSSACILKRAKITPLT